MAHLLETTIMPYAWGSRTVLAELTGREAPSAGPEAELWMGAHPGAPSRIVREGAPPEDLAVHIARAPAAALGEASVARFGARLPFLLKVLAAAEPLSLQAHPDRARAEAGYAEEEARGVPRDAAHRNYKDASHKPELICALTPFDALCGFRRVEDTLALFDALAVPSLSTFVDRLRGAPPREGLRAMFEALVTAPAAVQARVVDETVHACAAHGGRFALECAWTARLATLYPGDVGIVSALLLNLVHLEPGEAIYLGAGNLHAYLRGAGVEVMASSDNVLRGGLTKKHVDVPELLRVLDFVDGPVTPMRPRAVDAHEKTYDTPAAEFRLSVLEVNGALSRALRGAEILLCAAGAVRVTSGAAPTVALAAGRAAFVPASDASVCLDGKGVVYRATVDLE